MKERTQIKNNKQENEALARTHTKKGNSPPRQPHKRQKQTKKSVTEEKAVNRIN